MWEGDRMARGGRVEQREHGARVRLQRLRHARAAPSPRARALARAHRQLRRRRTGSPATYAEPEHEETRNSLKRCSILLCSCSTCVNVMLLLEAR